MKKTLAAAGLIGACAACCATLLLPMLAGAGFVGLGALGGGLLAGLSLEAMLCVALPLAALAGFAVWSFRRRRAARTACGCESSCSSTGCTPAQR